MTPAQAAALLTIAAAYDNRKPDADAAKAWAMVLDDLPFEDCRAVVVQHYRNSREWLMPVNVVDGVKALRHDRLSKFGPFEVPDGLTPDEYSRFIGETKRRIADGELQPGDPVMPYRELVEQPGYTPAIEPAGTSVSEERKGSRDRVREAHERAKREAQAAEPARCSCTLDQLAAKTATDCLLHAGPEEQTA